MSTATHIDSVKTRKIKVVNFAIDYYWNHPNRQSAIETSGSLSYTIDQRDFTAYASALSASTFEFSLNFALADAYARVFEARPPWRANTTAGVPSVLVSGEFAWAHRPYRHMWQLYQAMEPTADAKIGSCVETPYTRPTTSDPWAAGSTITTDIDFRFTTTTNGGGEPNSGGKGDDSDDEKVEVGFAPVFSGTESSQLPDLSITAPYILRLPWDDPWAAETTWFSDAFDDHLDAQNTLDGGGHSGSCTLSLDFS